jgi:hypothetical protein
MGGAQLDRCVLGVYGCAGTVRRENWCRVWVVALEGLSGSVLVDKEGYTCWSSAGSTVVVHTMRWSTIRRCVRTSNQSSVVIQGILGQLILFYLEKIVFYFYIYLLFLVLFT